MIRIFLAHASEDKAAVTRLYMRLKEEKFEPWLDKFDLLPGQNWRSEIPKVIKNSQVFIACLSEQSVAKQGYIQREFRMALTAIAERPADQIFLIPVRLDECQIPELRQEDYGISLTDYQWVNLFEPDGYERLVEAIRVGFADVLESLHYTEARYFEAAAPQQTLVAQSFDVIAMISLDSQRLINSLPNIIPEPGILTQQDVSSSEIPLVFPTKSDTKSIQPILVYISIFAPEFEVTKTLISLRVGPKIQSGLARFHLVSNKIQKNGQVVLSLYEDNNLNNLITSLRLSTKVLTHRDLISQKAWKIASSSFRALAGYNPPKQQSIQRRQNWNEFGSKSESLQDNSWGKEKRTAPSITWSKRNSLIALFVAALTTVTIAIPIFVPKNTDTPKTLDGRWEGTLGPVEISFEVEEDQVNDLNIVYTYPESSCDGYSGIKIKGETKQSTIITESSFKTSAISAEYTAGNSGTTTRGNQITIEGAFELENKSVSGTLDFSPNQLNFGTPCLTEQNNIQWSAQKLTAPGAGQ